MTLSEWKALGIFALGVFALSFFTYEGALFVLMAVGVAAFVTRLSKHGGIAGQATVPAGSSSTGDKAP